MIIGLHGFAQVGKDTLAGILIKKHGFTRLAFADPMREALLKLNPTIALEAGESATLCDLVCEHGWDDAKVAFPEIRRLLQVFGTDVGRQMFGENIWVEMGLKQMRQSTAKNFVFTDVRFQNELDGLREAGGYMVKIVRPGYGSVNAHVSDAGLDDKYFDFVVNNCGDIFHLEEQVEDLLKDALFGK